MKLFWLCWFCWLGSIFPLAAQTQVALFKNGTSFFTKNLRLETANGSATLTDIPKATFGTLWFATEGNRIRSIRTVLSPRTTASEAQELAGLLRANVGKKMTLSLAQGGNLEGTLEMARPQYVTLKTSNGWQNVPMGEIRSFLTTEKPATQLQVQDSVQALKIDFANAAATQNLSLGYLRKGIAWLPTYRIDLTDEKIASVTLHAEVLNDAEDLSEAQLNFVVGVPNFAYQYLASPLSYTGDVLSFINQLNRTSNQSYSPNRRSDNLMAQSMSNAYASSNYDDSPGGGDLEGSEAEDLFFYKSQTVTLRKGERAMLPVLQVTGACEHVYEVELPSSVSLGTPSPADEEENRRLVWHSILLKNEGKLPWTTGAALLTQRVGTDQRPLAQDKLAYTPPGAKAKIRITVATNVFVKDNERELSRKEMGKLKDSYVYDLLTIEAKIEVRNFKDKDIKLKVERQVEGLPLKSDIDWKIEKLVNLDKTYNTTQRISWELALKPGERKEVTYQYQIYLRR